LDGDVLRAPYDRSGLTAGIVHLGVGGFHRAHQARYVDDLLRRGDHDAWAIHGVGVLPADTRMRDALHQHDGLYTLAVKHADGSVEQRTIGSILGMSVAPEDAEAAVERLADPATRIVSLTVTEGGYAVPPKDELTWFWLVTESLSRRRSRGLPAYTVMSCDNILGNGGVARKALEEYGADLDGVRFPSSMVDRITPVTTDDDRALLQAADPWPVVCEPWTQWVLEDDFGLGRPAFEDVGVQVVDDVEPYELMKLRLLNGSHQAMAYLGHLAGYGYAHEVCADPLFVRFLQAFMAEVVPTLRPVPGIDLDAYQRSLVERFANPAIRDTLARLCAESSARIPNWLTPVIRELLDAGRPVDHLALVVASWARYAEGVDEQGRPIEVVDAQRDRVLAAAARGRFLEELFPELPDAPFREAFDRGLQQLRERGARATLEARA
jgi:mannitol 2-dehydrogenase